MNEYIIRLCRYVTTIIILIYVYNILTFLTIIIITVIDILLHMPKYIMSLL